MCSAAVARLVLKQGFPAEQLLNTRWLLDLQVRTNDKVVWAHLRQLAREGGLWALQKLTITSSPSNLSSAEIFAHCASLTTLNLRGKDCFVNCVCPCIQQ